MGKGKVERGIYGDEPGNDSVVRYPYTEEIGHESLTLKPICRAVNISGLKRFATENLFSPSRLRARDKFLQLSTYEYSKTVINVSPESISQTQL